MTDALIVFTVQFVYILVMGLQSQAVNHGRHAQAAIQSFLLGCFGFHITATIAAHRGAEGGLVWWCYVVSGPCGIVSSMLLFKRMRK